MTFCYHKNSKKSTQETDCADTVQIFFLLNIENSFLKFGYKMIFFNIFSFFFLCKNQVQVGQGLNGHTQLAQAGEHKQPKKKGGSHSLVTH